MTVTYGGTTYYYATNLQGDVIAILNSAGTKVVSYTYDAWGNSISVAHSMASTLGTLNPLRYRGYVYDHETGLYYLQSRYYNPKVGRFINADALVSTGQGLLGNNMFAYCGNNPVNNIDPTGLYFEPVPVYFDDPGNSYIIDQDEFPYGYFRYGLTSISHGGCGVVASYNALVSMGQRKPFLEVLEYFKEHAGSAVFWGLGGMLPYLVADYFREQGYNVILTSDIDLIDALSETADASILWYMFETDSNIFGFGAHFIEYSRVGKRYVGRNTSGMVSYFDSPSEYGYSGKRFYAVGIFIFK